MTLALLPLPLVPPACPPAPLPRGGPPPLPWEVGGALPAWQVAAWRLLASSMCSGTADSLPRPRRGPPRFRRSDSYVQTGPHDSPPQSSATALSRWRRLGGVSDG